jgi:hypothetical protein
MRPASVASHSRRRSTEDWLNRTERTATPLVEISIEEVMSAPFPDRPPVFPTGTLPLRIRSSLLSIASMSSVRRASLKDSRLVAHHRRRSPCEPSASRPSTDASITRWRSLREPSVLDCNRHTDRSITAERLGPQPGWLRSNVPTVIVSVSLEQRRTTSAAAISPERTCRLSSERAARMWLARSSARSRRKSR